MFTKVLTPVKPATYIKVKTTCRSGIDFTFAQTREISLIGTIAHSWLQEEVKIVEGRDDVTWATLGLAVDF